MTPGDSARGVEEEENADENHPDGAAKGAEEAELIAGGTVVGQPAASVSHLTDKEPYAESDEDDGDDPMDREGVEEASVANEEEAAESDEPDGAGGETVSRRSYEIWVDWIAGDSIGRDWGNGRSIAVPRGAPTGGWGWRVAGGRRGVRVGGGRGRAEWRG
jgi:hypothetical protein